jgi:hypothetical protein
MKNFIIKYIYIKEKSNLHFFIDWMLMLITWYIKWIWQLNFQIIFLIIIISISIDISFNILYKKYEETNWV